MILDTGVAPAFLRFDGGHGRRNGGLGLPRVLKSGIFLLTF